MRIHRLNSFLYEGRLLVPVQIPTQNRSHLAVKWNFAVRKWHRTKK